MDPKSCLIGSLPQPWLSSNVSASRDFALLDVPRTKRWKRHSKNAFITSFVTDFQISDMYALVVATLACASEDGNDDGINFWIDNFLLSQ